MEEQMVEKIGVHMCIIMSVNVFQGGKGRGQKKY